MDLQSLQKILSEISVSNSSLSGAGWKLVAGESSGAMYLQWRWLGTCAVTGAVEPMSSRKWMISSYAVKQEIIRTAFLALQQAVLHELEEGFKYRNRAIYCPHIDPDVLWEHCNELQVREDANAAS